VSKPKTYSGARINLGTGKSTPLWLCTVKCFRVGTRTLLDYIEVQESARSEPTRYRPLVVEGNVELHEIMSGRSVARMFDHPEDDD